MQGDPALVAFGVGMVIAGSAAKQVVMWRMEYHRRKSFRSVQGLCARPQSPAMRKRRSIDDRDGFAHWDQWATVNSLCSVRRH